MVTPAVSCVACSCARRRGRFVLTPRQVRPHSARAAADAVCIHSSGVHCKHHQPPDSCCLPSSPPCSAPCTPAAHKNHAPRTVLADAAEPHQAMARAAKQIANVWGETVRLYCFCGGQTGRARPSVCWVCDCYVQVMEKKLKQKLDVASSKFGVGV